MDLLSSAGDLLSGWLNNSAALDRQERAQNFSANQYATRYQTTVKDMQAAGLNPMLAYSQGASSAPTSSAASSSGYSSLGTSINQSRATSAQESLNKAQEGLITEQTGVATASKAEVEARTRNLDADTLAKQGLPALYAAQVVNLGANTTSTIAGLGKIEADIKHIDAQIALAKSSEDRNRAEIELTPQRNALLIAQAYLQGKQAMLTGAHTAESGARTGKIGVESKLLGLQVPGAENRAAAEDTATGRAAAHAKKVGEIGSSFWDVVNPLKGWFGKKTTVEHTHSKGK